MFKKISLFIIMVVLCVCGILIYNKKIKTIDGFNKYEVQNFDKNLSVDDKAVYEVFKNKYIVKVNANSFKMTNLDNEIVYRDNINAKNIIYEINDNYIAIASKLNNDVYLYNEKGKKYSVKVEKPIVGININENGFLVVIQEMNEENLVSVFNDAGRKLLDRISYQNKSGIPMYALITNDNRFLTVSYVRVDGLKVNSEMINFDLVSEDKIDSIYSTNIMKDKIIYKIEEMNNSIYAYTEEGITKVNILSNDKRELKITNKIIKEGMVKDKIVIISSSDTGKRNMNNISIYDDEFKLIETFNILDNISYVKLDKSYIIVGMSDIIEAYNLRTKKMWMIKVPQIINKVSIISNKKILLSNDMKIDELIIK